MKTPTEIQDTLKKSQSTISQQLKILQQAGLIQVKQEGVKKKYGIKSPQIYKVLENIRSFMITSSQTKTNVENNDLVDVLF